MDLLQLQLPSMAFMVSLFILPLLLNILFRRAKAPNPNPNLPPSPWKLPIIGHIHHLMLGGAYPHRTLRDMAAKLGPIMHLKLGEVDHIVITSPEAAKEIMNTHDLNFSNRPQLLFGKIMTYGNKGIVFALHGSYWQQLRKICMLELLSSSRIKAFRPIREEAVADLVEEISVSGAATPVNLSRKFLMLNSLIVARAAFGKECKHGMRFLDGVKEVLPLLNGFSLPDIFPSVWLMGALTGAKGKMERVHRELDDILGEVIKEHQAKERSKDGEQEGGDIVDVLLRLKDSAGREAPLTLTSIKAVIFDVFLAGSETSSTALEWAMSELVKNPAAMKKAQAEVRRAAGEKGRVEEADIEGLRYLKQAIKEALRLHPPVPVPVPRLSTEACEVGGFSIPAGSRILINAWAIGRDERYWEDPDSFRPERFDGGSVDFRGGSSFEFVPFGGGRRICPGIGFGLAGMELALAQLLFHFDWELPGGKKLEDLDMTERFTTTVVRQSKLLLIAKPYVPLPVAASC